MIENPWPTSAWPMAGASSGVRPRKMAIKGNWDKAWRRVCSEGHKVALPFVGWGVTVMTAFSQKVRR
jgi:hypothetical protein